MDKNTIIAIVLSTIVVVAGFTLQNVFFPSEHAQTTQQTEIPATNANQASVVGGGAVPEGATTEIEPSVTAITESQAEDPLGETTYMLETKLVRVEFTNKGGDIVSYKVKDRNGKNEPVEMADGVTSDNRAFSLLLGDSSGTPVSNFFKMKRISDTSIGFYQTFTVKNQDGSESSFTLVKQYTFNPDDYMFELMIAVDGDSTLKGLQFGSSAYTIRTSPQIGPRWNEKQNQYEYRKFYQFANGKMKTLQPGAGKTDKSKTAVSWAAVSGKYFALVVLPEHDIQQTLYSRVPGVDGATTAQMFLSRAPITTNKNTDIWRIYIGPRTENELGKYEVTAKNPYGLSDAKINKIADSGILAPLEILLKWIMEFFFQLIPNWGVSIIILTFLMRIILFPFTKKSTEASLKMQELQPKMQEIQTKYKDNQQKMNEEMSKFYQSVGYNPLSGCLPVLIQFPLIFAMYNLFNNYFEFRGAMFIPGWIPDLSQGDSLVHVSFVVPLLGWSELRLLPIIYVFSQLLYGKVTQTPGSAQQNSSMKFMLYGMPLIFFFIFYNAPSGLLIYWIFSNVLTLVQQVIINRMMHIKKESGLKLVKR
jgi:YidC/Oxa1 family membrane protein insertase